MVKTVYYVCRLTCILGLSSSNRKDPLTSKESSTPSEWRPRVGKVSYIDSWSLSHLGYLYPGTTPVVIKLDHNRSCPWV